MYPLWFIITAAVVVYLIVTAALTRFLAIGEVKWWERVAAWLWPVTLLLLALYAVIRLVFWPDV